MMPDPDRDGHVVYMFYIVENSFKFILYVFKYGDLSQTFIYGQIERTQYVESGSLNCCCSDFNHHKTLTTATTKAGRRHSKHSTQHSCPIVHLGFVLPTNSSLVRLRLSLENMRLASVLYALGFIFI